MGPAFRQQNETRGKEKRLYPETAGLRPNNLLIAPNVLVGYIIAYQQ